jgi:hypothetical protein
MLFSLYRWCLSFHFISFHCPVTYYGLCRLWDLSWGNRPSSLLPNTSNHGNAMYHQSPAVAAEAVARAQREKVKNDLIDDSRLVCVLLLIFNVILVLVMTSYQSSIYVVVTLLALSIGPLWIHYGIALLFIMHSWYSYFLKPRSQPRAGAGPAATHHTHSS